MVRRTCTYVVCSTPRSGSGLLCRGLAATGVVGTPIEYFNPEWRSSLSARWGCDPGLGAYVSELMARRRSVAGVFGIKLHWDQLSALRAEMPGAAPGEPPFELAAGFLEELLGRPLTYIHVLRRDVDRQAVSLWTAGWTGVWAARGGGGPPRVRVPYSFDGIEQCRRRVALGELHWDRFFRFNGIAPVTVVYEDLCRAYSPVLARVAAEIAPEAVAEPAPPVTARQADQRSEDLLERFRADLARAGRPPSLRRRVAHRVRSFLR